MENLKTFKSWEKQSLVTLCKDADVIYLVLEFNEFYGDLITRFQIGDTPHNTNVLIGIDYCGSTQEFLDCAEHNGRVRERSFENGSVTWEFLWKPLGLEKPEPKSNCVSYPKYTCYFDFKAAAEKMGWNQLEKNINYCPLKEANETRTAEGG